MAYVGRQPEIGNFRKCDAITTSATATYNLLVGGVAVNPNQNQVICSLNGVVQSSGTSYTIASSQITFASALTSSDVIDFILILGDVLDVGVPSDDTVDASKITANVITGQTALGATPADTDEFLVSDAGTLKRVDYSHIKGITQTSFLPTANPLMYNANMSVNQRGDSTGLTGHGYHSVDRFGTYITSGGTWSQSLAASSLGLQGFPNSLLMDNTTANGSLSANSDVRIYQDFEGQDLQLLKKGTANAEKITIAFWVYGTKTGTHIVELYDGNGRTCSQSYTISSTNTWEHKVVNFPADTSGTLADDNTQQLSLIWWLCAGTDYTSGSLQTTWASVTAANRAVGQVNCADSTSNNWQITGVQMEVGEYTSSDLPPFRHESYGDNLRRCERYYQVISQKRGSSYENEVIPATQYDSSQFYATYNFRTVMRTPPTLSCASGTNYFRFYRGGSYDDFDDYSLDKSSVNSVSLYNDSDMSGTGGQGGWTRWVNNAPDNSLVALIGEL